MKNLHIQEFKLIFKKSNENYLLIENVINKETGLKKFL
jgi:hypothetical protein